VALVTLSGDLAVGDKIQIKGATTDFEQVVKSMQIEHESINSAKKGQMIGLKVENKVRLNDEVFIVE
jgi:putative protease